MSNKKINIYRAFHIAVVRKYLDCYVCRYIIAYSKNILLTSAGGTVWNEAVLFYGAPSLPEEACLQQERDGEVWLRLQCSDSDIQMALIPVL